MNSFISSDLVGRLAEVGKAALLIKDFCNDVYLFIAHCHTPPSLLEVPLGLDHTGSILLIKLFPDFRAFVLVDILVAPEVEVSLGCCSGRLHRIPGEGRNIRWSIAPGASLDHSRDHPTLCHQPVFSRCLNTR